MEIVLTARRATDSTALNDLKARGDGDLAYRRISYSSKRSTKESRTNREKKGLKQFKERSGTATVHVFLRFLSSTLVVVTVNTHKGPYLNDVRKIFRFFYPLPPPPFIRISRNLSVLFVRKIGQFFNPPPSLRADVI